MKLSSAQQLRSFNTLPVTWALLALSFRNLDSEIDDLVMIGFFGEEIRIGYGS